MNNTSMNPCFGCGKPLHISAPSCPHCGAVQNLPNQLGPNAAMRSVNGVEPKSKVTAGVLALLLGALLVFGMLAALMWATRQVDRWRLGGSDAGPAESPTPA